MASNYKMDNGSRLLKIGYEAFLMLEEEEYGRKGTAAAATRQKAPAPRQKAPARPATARQPEPAIPVCWYPYQPQKPLVYQMMNPVSSTEEMVTSYDAPKLQDGLLIMDYSKRKSAAMAY